jgi:hypothetical protein
MKTSKFITTFSTALLPFAAVLTITAAPLITQQPAAQSVSLGASVAFSVTASGTAPLTYQWLKNEQPLQGATNRSLILTNVVPANAGNYSAAVTDATSATTNSQAALLEVDPTFTKITTGAIVTDRGDHEGTAWADYDNDGLIDLYTGTGASGPNSFLYRNAGNGTFTKMTSATGGSIVQTGGEDCAWGDYDNDGFLDLFVTTASQPSALHRNNGNGTFTRITTGPMLPSNGNDHRGCAWGDFDNDGHLDLFVSSGPRGGGRNALYRNNGDGTFTTITNRPFNLSALSVNCAWADYNNDGRLDLFSSAGAGSLNFLYRNDGEGSFTSMTATTAGSLISDVVANTGTWGDYDNDGYLDIFVAGGPFGSPSYLYRNDGTGKFSRINSTLVGSLPVSAVAGAWGDYDNDGHLDLFVAHFNSARNSLYRNNGNGTLTRVDSGSPVNDAGIYRQAYSCAWGDYDNDGFLDLVVGNVNSGTPSPRFLYRNNGTSNAWIKVRCVGTVSNRSAIGAKVRVRATIGGKTYWQLREISGGGGYGGQNLIAHFGLGDAQAIETLRIEWPSGIVQELKNLSQNQELTVTEPPKLVANGAGQFRVLSWKGQQFCLETSANLANWTLLGMITNATGMLEFTDTSALTASQRFYRTVVK